MISVVDMIVLRVIVIAAAWLYLQRDSSATTAASSATRFL